MVIVLGICFFFPFTLGKTHLKLTEVEIGEPR